MYYSEQRNISTLVNLAAAAFLAALTTFSLILLMQQLIHRDFDGPIDVKHTPIPKVVLEDREPPEERFEPVNKPEKIEEPPEIEPITKTTEFKTNDLIPVPAIEINSDKIGIQGSAGRFPIAQVFSSPRYPERALTRGIEGWVDVQFDITAHGTTENIQILRSQPEGYFEKAEGMQKRLVFEIQGKGKA